jgi:tRNA/rRNA methyltransferase
VVLVLDRPRDVTNVGGVVRAMGNFGLGRLRLVEPAAYDAERVLAMAHRGAPVLARLERQTPRQAAPALLCAAQQDPATPAAVLFGPEDRGLSNAALGRCNAVVTIPTAPDDPSLNLAQSALLVAYELWLAATNGTAAKRLPDAAAALATAPPAEPLARGAAREEMFAALEDVLWGMHPNTDAGRVRQTLARMRAVLLRAAPRAEEVQMLTRLFVHIAHERRQGGARERG